MIFSFKYKKRPILEEITPEFDLIGYQFSKEKHNNTEILFLNNRFAKILKEKFGIKLNIDNFYLRLKDKDVGDELHINITMGISFFNYTNISSLR